MPLPLLRGALGSILYSLFHTLLYFVVFPPVLFLYTHVFIPRVTQKYLVWFAFLFCLYFSVFVVAFKGFWAAMLITTIMASGTFFSMYVKPKNEIHIIYGAFMGVFWGVWLWKIVGGDWSRNGNIRRKTPEFYFQHDTRNIFSSKLS